MVYIIRGATYSINKVYLRAEYEYLIDDGALLIDNIHMKPMPMRYLWPESNIVH